MKSSSDLQPDSRLLRLDACWKISREFKKNNTSCVLAPIQTGNQDLPGFQHSVLSNMTNHENKTTKPKITLSCPLTSTGLFQASCSSCPKSDFLNNTYYIRSPLIFATGFQIVLHKIALFCHWFWKFKLALSKKPRGTNGRKVRMCKRKKGTSVPLASALWYKDYSTIIYFSLTYTALVAGFKHIQ